MARQCARCGRNIGDSEVRYHQHASGDHTATYCSVNCVADAEHVDEDAARNRLFADRLDR